MITITKLERVNNRKHVAGGLFVQLILACSVLYACFDYACVLVCTVHVNVFSRAADFI